MERSSYLKKVRRLPGHSGPVAAPRANRPFSPDPTGLYRQSVPGSVHAWRSPALSVSAPPPLIDRVQPDRKDQHQPDHDRLHRRGNVQQDRATLRLCMISAPRMAPAIVPNAARKRRSPPITARRDDRRSSSSEPIEFETGIQACGLDGCRRCPANRPIVTKISTVTSGH